MGTSRAPPSAGRHTSSQPSSSPQSPRCSASCSCRDAPDRDSRQGTAGGKPSPAHGKGHRTLCQLNMGEGRGTAKGFPGPGSFAPWSASPRARGRCTAPRPWCARRRRAGARCCRGRRGGARSRYRWPGPWLPHAAPGPPPPTLATARATVPPGPCKACRAPRAARKLAPPVTAVQRGGSSLPPPGSARGPAAGAETLAPRPGPGPP